MPRILASIRIAVASNNGEQVNGHFGSCLRYLVYQLSPESYELIDVRSAVEADLSDDRNAFRANLINDCHVLLIQTIGGPAAAKVVRAGVYPMKVKETSTVEMELERLQSVMVNSPPPWLAKILGTDGDLKKRFLPEDDV